VTGAGLAAASTFILAVVIVAPARAQTGAVDRGRRLFLGATPFAHGGPACAACHDTAALSRPGGGTMGPDLTTVSTRIGPEGIATALETLYFPAMTPLFSAHPLTTDERQALAAFLENPPPAPPRPARATVALGVAAAVGFVILLAITGVAGRSRIHSVRLALLARAGAGGRKAAS
jgi:mono/diheme cytochrome c family protein